MRSETDRREVIRATGLGLAALGATSLMGTPAYSAALRESVLPPGAETLGALARHLDTIPRRRGFQTVPMILDSDAQWDRDALDAIMAYRPRTKQVWDCTAIDGPWLNGMRNALNAQIWSFRHPDFLVAAAVHGSAQLALYDQAMWDKYQLTKLAGDKFKTNLLIDEKKAASADPKNYQDAAGVFSPHDNSIPALMRRGVVFLACHNAIWEQAGKLIEKELLPEKLSQEQVTAELSNHLVPGVVLTPGAVATIPELQQVGFHYIA